jgi:hypothetical protein
MGRTVAGPAGYGICANEAAALKKEVSSDWCYPLNLYIFEAQSGMFMLAALSDSITPL